MPRRTFNRVVTVPLEALEILKEKLHPVSGCRLIEARISGAGNDENAHRLRDHFITAWLPPWRKNIPVEHAYASHKWADHKFDTIKNLAPPVTSDTVKDWQREKVYDWERNFPKHLKPLYDFQSLSARQMQKIAEKIYAKYNLKPPAIVYDLKHYDGEMVGWYNDYNPKKPELVMYLGRFGYLIHEIAHDIDRRVNGNVWGGHGPSFVRTELDLFKGLDEEELEDNAEQAGVAIAPEGALPIFQFA